MRIKYLLTLLVAGGLASAAIANPYETTLKNGLRVIVKEDRRAPTAVQMVWYRIGSMDEVDGASGVAHVLEHMMFKGTPSVGPGEFNKRVAAAGGKDNAFTSRDYTAYFQQIPKEKLADMMALEADRMRHLNVDAKEFEQEIKVVMEERRMRTDDNPQAKLFEQMNAAAFQAHPYRRPIIGWMNDLENMTAADAKAWYDTWYVPNNAYVVITGDVDHKTVFALAEQHYGPLEGRALPVRRQQIEPKQEGTRRVTVKAPAELPVLIMGYKAPILRDVEQDSDPYALEMLAAILDGHDAARFNKKLVREDKVALAAGIEYDNTARGPGMLYLHGSPSEGKTVADLETALRAEITRVQREGGQRRRTEAGQGAVAGQRGLQKGFDVRPDHGNRPDGGCRPVLPETRSHAGQVAAGHRRTGTGRGQQVFQRRCPDRRRSRPATARRQAAPPGRRHPSLMKTAMKRLIAAAFALLLTQAALAGVKIEHWVSPSGARVYFVESRILPMLDVQVDFAAGSMFDPAGKSGLAALTRATLDNGAGKLDETAIAEQLADLGASLGGGADTDRASISLRTLSPRDKRDPALDILKTVVQAPLFDAAIFEREKARTIAGLKEAMTRPDSIAGKAFWAALYPEHPYGRQATPDTVAALTRDDLAAFHGRYYTAANASITLVGDLSRQEAERIADQLLAGLPP